ncbi:hypothetical protein GCM10011380_16810 [Sphingomonas metalli]|uniref:Antitoxin n=1 Tax=Sphingomonas metalli TaxID=1779358 RepID=A0A916T2C0_9SPHN|nr:type II toxin-antitoxin system prevent-host-death family antitoxin [Sphingomonas metalli]GGB27834.1 hypothetical protein GCM10011380_16810 [Sphingomonas metalli]
MAEADPQKTFNVHEAKTQFSRLIDRAHAGEEIIVAKDGEPWARLMPIEPAAKRRRIPGRWPELSAIPDSVWSRPLSDEELTFIDDRPEAERR